MSGEWVGWRWTGSGWQRVLAKPTLQECSTALGLACPDTPATMLTMTRGNEPGFEPAPAKEKKARRFGRPLRPGNASR